MKKLLFLLMLVGSMQSLYAQFTIPDIAFALKLHQIFPGSVNGNVLDTNHTSVISATSLYLDAAGISDLSGIQFFDSLVTLDCSDNQLAGLPTLPSSLTILECSGNQLTSLPSLPSSLTHLDCSGNQLTSLPSLPNSLYFLNSRINQLTTLPPLPSSLLNLHCSSNLLTSLPALSDSLWFLDCSNNQLMSLPSLSDSLKVLYCMHNQLTSLPSLPNSLMNLYCANNLLTSLPSLSDSLKILYCNNNLLTSLPALPSSLEYLQCAENQISCLPYLPASLELLECFNNQISCLPNLPPLVPPFGTAPGESNLGFSAVLCIPSSACFLETISGTIYLDANGNGIFDTFEIPLAYGAAEAQPSGNIGGSDSNGSYRINVDAGSYVVQGQALPYHNITTPAHSVTITPGHIDSLNHIGYQAIPGIYDLVAEISAQVTRPGFDNNVYLQVKNIGTEATTTLVDFDFDAAQTWVASTVVPSSQNGNTAGWSVSVSPGDTWNTTITLNTAVGVALGTAIDHLLTATPTVSDTTPANNTANWTALVVGSNAPNDKTALPSRMNPTQLLSGDAIEYTIRFQNTGTFPAENVRITDVLSTALEWSSIEYISSSHSNYWYLSNGVLVFQYDNIQLPDSASDEPNSHGFVKFRIKPNQNLLEGDSVLNTANIFFDFNEPVITDPNIFMISSINGLQDRSLAWVRIFPNPTRGVLNIQSEQIMKQITVVQLDGRLVRSEIASGIDHQLNIGELQQGVYLLNVETENGRSVNRIVVGK